MTTKLPIKIEKSDDLILIKTPQKQYYSVMLKISGVDIFHFTDEDKMNAYRNFGRATKSLDLPYKYIFSTSSVSLDEQKKYVSYKLKTCNNQSQQYYLKREHNRFEYIENNHYDRVCYLVIYGKNKVEVKTNATRYICEMQDTSVVLLSSDEQVDVFSNIIKSSNADTYADNILEQILPHKILFKERYLVQDDSVFSTCITAYEYPVEFLNLQFASIFASFDDNVVITLDCELARLKDVKSNLSATMRELRGRRELSQSQEEEIDSESDLADLSNLYTLISRGDEQIVATTLRFYIKSDSIEQLEYIADTIEKEIEGIGIKCFVNENNMVYDYLSILTPSNTIQNYFPVEDTFKYQYPFYYQSLTDKSGFYLGQTTTQGQVIFNPFLQTSKRTSYDILISGVKGSGKSVLLKSMVAEQLSQGNKVFLIDLEAEYIKLSEHFGGKVLKMSKNTIINPLQLFQSVADGDTSEESNFTSELSRIEIFFRQFLPMTDEFEISVLMQAVEMCLFQKGITDTTDLSTLSNEDFPTISDLYNTIKQMLFKSEKTSATHQALERLEVFIKQLSSGANSTMFNGHTTIDISKEQLVVFDVKELAEQTDRVFNAYLTNILALMWAEMCKNVLYNTQFTNPYDHRRVVIIIEEAHRFISSDNVYAFMEKLLRRSRKYEAGLWFASQIISDYNENSSKLFALVQYKFLLKQTAESLPVLKELFPQFTLSELTGLENFQAGEMLLSIDGKTKLHCKKIIANEDFAWLGNSRDKIRLAEEGIYI